ncbi:MAG: hypothetical protein L5656_07735 [Thermanaeromonas sp.]|nr:hypothetical protein [Thermanaeromonas sp.]
MSKAIVAAETLKLSLLRLAIPAFIIKFYRPGPVFRPAEKRCQLEPLISESRLFFLEAVSRGGKIHKLKGKCYLKEEYSIRKLDMATSKEEFAA